MKISNQSKLNFIKIPSQYGNFSTNKIKTTNVNILLNRVRLDRKKDFKKKIIILSLLAIVICLTSFFAII